VDWKAVLNECWDLAVRCERTPSIVGSIRMARELGAIFNDKEARDVLRPRVTQLAPRATQQIVRDYPALPSADLGSRERADHNGVVSVVPIVQDLSLLASLGVAPKAPPAPSKNGKKPKPPKPLDSIRAETAGRVTALSGRQIRTLEHRELYDVATEHALRYLPAKARSPTAARSLALGLMQRIVNVVSAADHREMADLTVGEYFSHGDEIFAAGDGAPWEQPWALVAWLRPPQEAIP
jgi:hypothetical protein